MSLPALIEHIDLLLPQTQCGQCGHPGCRPYAEAIAAGEALNRCPPGGDRTIHELAALLGRPALPLDSPTGRPTPAQVAVIRETECIGCTKCIQACPVDAILGAAKRMHVVIADECSGCELCLAPCPVDCIDLLPIAEPEPAERRQRADQYRRRYQARLRRLRGAAAPARAPTLRATAPSSEATGEALGQAPGERPLSAIERIKARKTAQATAASVDGDQARQRAQSHAAMARARLQRAIKAYGPTPDTAQREQLDVLRQDADDAQRQLERFD